MAAGETEATQENIQDWLELDERDPGFQLLTEEETAAEIFLIYFVSTTYIIKISIYLLSKIFCPVGTASVVLWSEFLATYPEVPVLIPGATRFSEK
jgi:hypothetical protein